MGRSLGVRRDHVAPAARAGRPARGSARAAVGAGGAWRKRHGRRARQHSESSHHSWSIGDQAQLREACLGRPRNGPEPHHERHGPARKAAGTPPPAARGGAGQRLPGAPEKAPPPQASPGHRRSRRAPAAATRNRVARAGRRGAVAMSPERPPITNRPASSEARQRARRSRSAASSWKRRNCGRGELPQKISNMAAGVRSQRGA